MKTMKFFLRLCLLLILLTPLTSCLGEQVKKVKTPLTKLNPDYKFPKQAMEIEFAVPTENVKWQSELKEILAEYSTIHPQITIKLINKWIEVGHPRADIQLLTLKEFGISQPAHSPLLAPDWVAEELQNRLDDKSYLSACIQKRLFGVPRELALDKVLFYNKSLLMKAGFDRPPHDTIELIEWAKKLTIYDQKGQIIQAGWASPWTGLRPWLLPEQDIKKTDAAIINRTFVRHTGVWPSEVVRKEIMTDFKPLLFCFIDGAVHNYLFKDDYFSVNLNHPEVIAALDYYQKFIWEFRIASLLFPKPGECLKQGLAAMAYLEPDFWYELQRDAGQWEWGVAPQVVGKLPYGKFLPAYIPQPGTVWAVTTQDKQKIEICWDILLFTFLNHDLQLAQAEGTFPLLKENWETEYAKQHYLAPVAERQLLRPVIMTEFHPLRNKLETYLEETVCRVVATSIMAEKALNDLAIQANLILRYSKYW